LHVGYIPEPDTIYEAIKKFPAGNYAIIKPGESILFNKYWSASDFLRSSKSWTEKDAFPALRKVLETAVQKRLISDVPLGAFLSGGTDSSLITAIASKLKKDKLKTFSIGFFESAFDESKMARRVAEHLKTDHHEYMLHENEAVDILETYLKHFDEPFADTSAIPTMLVSKLARNHVKVALTGDGGDELFLGYGAYDWATRLETPLYKILRQPLAMVMREVGSPRMKRISYMLESVKRNHLRSHIFSQEQYFFTEREIVQDLKLDAGLNCDELMAYLDPVQCISNAEQQALYDIQHYLKDDLLVKVDRASMYYGLECRSPFLDHNIIEMALSLPPQLKRYGNQRKGFLKKLLSEHLPAEIVNKPKWGFSVPLSKWLMNELSYLVDKYLNQDLIESIGLVHYAYVNKLKKSFNGGDTFLYNRLWVLIVLHKWLHENS
jgi:asparagine synthase (glutamine-hydrolysing)